MPAVDLPSPKKIISQHVQPAGLAKLRVQIDQLIAVERLRTGSSIQILLKLFPLNLYICLWRSLPFGGAVIELQIIIEKYLLCGRQI